MAVDKSLLLQLQPKTGLWVSHLFLKKPDPSNTTRPSEDSEGIFLKILKDFEESHLVSFEPQQVIATLGLGHKFDYAVMALSKDPVLLAKLKLDIVEKAELKVSYSYLSLTEISEYAEGIPEEMKQQRLYPTLPKDKPIWCFYPMSKSRGEVNNWFTLPLEKRKELMHEHGTSGRNFAGRVVQIITGSTGIDDFEWGVTLFCDSPETLKEVVYTMRFDEASAKYAEFGPFYTGLLIEI